MTDRPTAAELVEAVRQLLEAEVIPALPDVRLRFQALVAANVLSIVGRELAAADVDVRLTWDKLAAVLGMADPPPTHPRDWRAAVLQLNEELCRRIRAGDYDDPARFRELVNQLRPLIVRKLEIANPRFLAGYEPC
jgi:Domain of unknown function (DUF6285)